MPTFVRAALALVLLAAPAAAATPDQIDAAIAKGVGALKTRFKNPGGGGNANGGGHGIGPTALAGIAILEAKTPAGDPTLKAIAAAVRDQAYRETNTYQLALCLIFLDRLEDPADVPLIQMLGVRLLAGQNGKGGWGYTCVDTIPQADEQRLRAGLKSAELTAGKGGAGAAPKGAGKLHPVVQEYAAALAARGGGNRVGGDDNSNTQFGVLAVWAARKYGVPCDTALDLIEQRFRATQDQAGGWAYTGDGGGMGGTPAMTCAGLLGMATAIGRREERRAKAEAPKVEPPPGKANDPFFNPPPRPDGKAPPGPKRPPDARDLAAGRGFAFLGAALTGRGPAAGPGEGGTQNLYFLWSLERVGVIYGVDRIGGIDWYANGADFLVRTQAADGTWKGSYSEDIDTSFAVLFLSKANLAQDLSRRVRGENATELRSGNNTAAPAEAAPVPKGPVVPANPLPVPVAAPLPAGAAGKVAADLLAAAKGPGWAKTLAAARDAKGADYTAGMVAAVHRLDGDRKKAARDALAERLTRMSAGTLRGMMASPDAELRRGAVLAAAMRDDKDHVPDLIDRLTDDELVVRAARAGLRSLTGQDFGPQPGASAADHTRAADAWRAWWARQKR